MGVTVIVAAQTTDLTTLQRVLAAAKAQSASSAIKQDIAALISEASDAVVRQLGRQQLAREQVAERLEGNDRTTLMVTRRPVVSIDQIDHDDLGSIPLTDVRIDDAGAGIIYREAFWPAERPRGMWLVVDELPQSGAAPWLVTMTAGFLLPGDDFSAKDFTLTTEGVLTRATGRMPLLVAGDVVRLRGFNDNNNGRWPVLARTNTTLTLDGDFTAETVGSDGVVEVRNLDARLERAVTETVKAWYLSEGRDPALSSESLGDWSAQYGGGKFASVKRGVIPESVLATLEELSEVAQA